MNQSAFFPVINRVQGSVIVQDSCTLTLSWTLFFFVLTTACFVGHTVGMIVYMITFLMCIQTNLIPIIKSFSMVYYLEYTDFEIDIAILVQELMHDKYLAYVTLVTEDDKHVRAHKIILSSSSVLLMQDIQD